MCYNYSIKTPAKDLENRYKATLETLEEFKPVYHTSGFTYSKLPVITNDLPGTIQMFNWGLVPFWNKDKANAFQARTNTLNARCDTIFEKPSFRTSISSKRCLVPATGFFEWMDVNKKKIPFFISLKNHEIFSFAGIWDVCRFKNENGEIECVSSFSILTVEANPLMEKIHNLKKRMPFILHPEQEQIWISHELSKEKINSLMLPFPEEEMIAYPISKLITSRTQSPNVPEVLDRAEYVELEGKL